jgi:hypothetical protein
MPPAIRPDRGCALNTTYTLYVELLLFRVYINRDLRHTCKGPFLGQTMKDHEPGSDGQTPAEAAAYIAELCGDLSSIARRQQLDTLVYILDMARLEAQNLIRPPGGKASSVQ